MASYVSCSSSNDDWYSNSLRMILMTLSMPPTALIKSRDKSKIRSVTKTFIRLRVGLVDQSALFALTEGKDFAKLQQAGIVILEDLVSGTDQL